MKKHYLVGYKLFFSLLGFSALITEMAVLWATDSLVPSNFFSYFTVEANTIAFLVFLISAMYTFAGKKSAKLDFIRGAATYFMVLTGIVFAALLAGLEGVKLTAVPWDNVVLHYIVPIAFALDWLMDPPAHRIAFKKSLAWFAFPIAYLAYSLVRGPIVGFYPYPFLNPAYGGYGRIAFVAAGIVVLSIVICYVITRLTVKAGKK